MARILGVTIRRVGGREMVHAVCGASESSTSDLQCRRCKALDHISVDGQSCCQILYRTVLIENLACLPLPVDAAGMAGAN
jgi:hypothetical protein